MYTGTSVYWCTGTSVYWYTGTSVYWCTGTSVYWFTGTSVHWFTGIIVMHYSNYLTGSDLVDWLHNNVEGFIDRRHARKYAAIMLKVK